MAGDGRKQAGRGHRAPPPEWEGSAPAGWYLDPDEAPLQRYWDGSAWTEDTRDEPLGVLGSRGDRRGTQVIMISVVVILVVGALAAIAASIPSG